MKKIIRTQTFNVPKTTNEIEIYIPPNNVINLPFNDNKNIEIVDSFVPLSKNTIFLQPKKNKFSRKKNQSILKHSDTTKGADDTHYDKINTKPIYNVPTPIAAALERKYPSTLASRIKTRVPFKNNNNNNNNNYSFDPKTTPYISIPSSHVMPDSDIIINPITQTVSQSTIPLKRKDPNSKDLSHASPKRLAYPPSDTRATTAYSPRKTGVTTAPAYSPRETGATTASVYPPTDTRATTASAYPPTDTRATTASAYSPSDTRATTASAYPPSDTRATTASAYPPSDTRATTASVYSPRETGVATTASAYPPKETGATTAPSYPPKETGTTTAPSYSPKEIGATIASAYPPTDTRATTASAYPPTDTRATTASAYSPSDTRATTASAYPPSDTRATTASAYPPSDTRATTASVYSPRETGVATTASAYSPTDMRTTASLKSPKIPAYSIYPIDTHATTYSPIETGVAVSYPPIDTHATTYSPIETGVAVSYPPIETSTAATMSVPYPAVVSTPTATPIYSPSRNVESAAYLPRNKDKPELKKSKVEESSTNNNKSYMELKKINNDWENEHARLLNEKDLRYQRYINSIKTENENDQKKKQHNLLPLPTNSTGRSQTIALPKNPTELLYNRQQVVRLLGEEEEMPKISLEDLEKIKNLQLYLEKIKENGPNNKNIFQEIERNKTLVKNFMTQLHQMVKK